MKRPRNPGLTTWLTAGVLVALPLMAALQFHWLSRIGEDARSRLLAVTENAGRSLSQDLGFETIRAARERFAGSSGAPGATSSDPGQDANPSLVVDAFILDRAEDDDVRLRRWDLGARDVRGGALA